MSTFSPKPDSSYYISPALWEEPCCYWAVEDVHKKVTLRGLDIVDNSLVKLQFVKQANSDYYAIKSVKGYLGLDGAKLTVCAKDETPTLFSIHQIGAYVTFAQQHNPLSLLQCEDGYRGNSTDIQIYAHSVTNTTFTDYSQIPDDLFPFLWKLDDVDINPRHWMSHPALDTTKKLNQLALCGTHDTATYKWSRGNYSKTQDQSIYKQLTFGIRYLDIRLGIDLETYHGGSNDVSFKSVLDQISEFFSAPGCADETIIMAINRDDGGGKSAGDEHQFVLQLDQIMKGTSNLIPPHANIKWYRENRVPQLSEVKGHIVLVRRYPATTNNNLGINLSMWGSTHDNDSFTATGIAGVNSVVVQDEYLLTQNSTKEGFIKSLFPNMISPTDTDDNWYLNFTSAAKGENPYSYSDEINPWLGTWLNFQTQLAGTFVMDYPSAALVGRIVRFNF